jgi:hypothetical protein
VRERAERRAARGTGDGEGLAGENVGGASGARDAREGGGVGDGGGCLSADGEL